MADSIFASLSLFLLCINKGRIGQSKNTNAVTTGTPCGINGMYISSVDLFVGVNIVVLIVGITEVVAVEVFAPSVVVVVVVVVVDEVESDTLFSATSVTCSSVVSDAVIVVVVVDVVESDTLFGATSVTGSSDVVEVVVPDTLFFVAVSGLADVVVATMLALVVPGKTVSVLSSIESSRISYSANLLCSTLFVFGVVVGNSDSSMPFCCL
jgi:hypothetical protein